MEVGEVLMHIRKGDATSPSFNINDWKAILEYNIYGDPSTSLFGKDPRNKSDVVFLLDGSGSMVSPEPGKWQAAVDASVLFYDLMKALRYPAFEDRYNSIAFRWLWPDNVDGTAAIHSDGLKDMTFPLTNAEFNPAFTPQSVYSTPMGIGLEQAAGQFTHGAEEDLYTDKMIILLSDGKHNKGIDPLEVVQAPEWPGAVRVYSVGLGEDDIEPETIEQIAQATYGEYRISPTPREIEGFFCEILCDISWKLQDVTVTGNSAPVDQGKAVFVAIWDDPAATISFDLIASDGSTLTPVSPGPYCSYHSATAGQTHSFYSCDGLPDDQLGTWQFVNQNDSGTSVAIDQLLLKVIIDPRTIASFELDNVRHFTGQPIVLTARITEERSPKTEVEEVSAELVRSPAMALGSLLAQNKPPRDYPVSPPAGSDISPKRHYLQGVMKQLGINQLSRTDSRLIKLTDDGTGFDAHKNDGVYTGVFLETPYEGSYTFRFRARGTNSTGHIFDRTETRSAYVRFTPNATATGLEMIQHTVNPDKKTITSIFRVTPRNESGDYLGPFLGDRIQLWSSAGDVRSEFSDNLDGTYDFTLDYPAEKEPTLSLAIDDQILRDRLPVKPEPVDDEQSLFWIFLFLLFLLALLVLSWKILHR
jgi:hypothetical protein